MKTIEEEKTEEEAAPVAETPVAEEPKPEAKPKKAAKKKAEAATAKFNTHILRNIYSYECVCSKAEWDSKGIWDCCRMPSISP